MLLPALSKAREKARGISCTSNMKQLGLMTAMYVDSSDDFIPPITDSTFYASWVRNYWAAGCLESLDTLVCPSQPKTKELVRNRLSSKSNLGEALVGYWFFSYGLNRFGLVDTGVARNIGEVKRPSGCFSHVECFYRLNGDVTGWEMPKDNKGYYYTVYYYSDKTMGVPNPAHGDRTNVLYVDGHCESLKRQAFWAPEADSKKFNDYWNYK